jgi:hypothetical protein
LRHHTHSLETIGVLGFWGIVQEGASGEKGIAISDAWMAELQKDPYHSSNYSMLMIIEKPGTGIFLMKESSKFYRPHKSESRGSSQRGLVDQLQAVQIAGCLREIKTRGRTWGMGNTPRCLRLSKAMCR